MALENTEGGTGMYRNAESGHSPMDEFSRRPGKDKQSDGYQYYAWESRDEIFLVQI
jgi:hypothetical protein